MATQPPAELFLHAKSSFTDEEWRGFKSGAPPETNVVGVQIADAKDNLKLFRPRQLPDHPRLGTAPWQ